MSEAVKVKTEPRATGPVVNRTLPSSPVDVIDLLSDSDDDAPALVSPPEASKGGREQRRKHGSYAKLGIYATSLRERKRPVAAEEEEEEEEAPTPNVITPCRKKKKTLSPVAKTKTGGAPTVGNVGYKFHKKFIVDEEDKMEMFHGEVVEILDRDAPNKKGKYRRCRYNDGAFEDLSLSQLRGYRPCTEEDCTIIASPAVSVEGNSSNKSTGQGGESVSTEGNSSNIFNSQEGASVTTEGNCSNNSNGQEGGLDEPTEENSEVDKERRRGAENNIFSIKNVLDKMQVEAQKNSRTLSLSESGETVASAEGEDNAPDEDNQSGQDSDKDQVNITDLFVDSSSDDEDKNKASIEGNGNAVNSPAVNSSKGGTSKTLPESGLNDFTVGPPEVLDVNDVDVSMEGPRKMAASDADDEASCSSPDFEKDRAEITCAEGDSNSSVAMHDQDEPRDEDAMSEQASIGSANESNGNDGMGKFGDLSEVAGVSSDNTSDGHHSNNGKSKSISVKQHEDEDTKIFPNEDCDAFASVGVGSMDGMSQSDVHRNDPNDGRCDDEDINSLGQDNQSDSRGRLKSQEGNNGQVDGTDDDEDLFACSDDDEHQEGNNGHADSMSDDDKDLFASSEDDKEEEGSNDIPAGNDKPVSSNSDDEDLFLSSGSDDNASLSNDDEDLFSSSDDDKEGDEQIDGRSGRLLNVSHPLYKDDDEDDRFSDGSVNGKDNGNPILSYSKSNQGLDQNTSRKDKRQSLEVFVPKKWGTTLVTEYTTPIVERELPESYYFCIQWGDRMRVRERPLRSGLPPSTFRMYGMKYKILFSELIARKGKGPAEDGMGRKNYKSYYLAVSGPGIEPMDLKSALLRIGDFESLTYEKGAHKTVSRLKLLVSPCSRPPGSNAKKKSDSEDSLEIFCMRRVKKCHVELIEENGHLGCGFIPRSLLVEVLGKSADAKKASICAMRVFAIQVRIIGPSSVGVAKGMLVVKDGIDKIQVPSSMVKVDKSKTEPLHDDVLLNVHKCFPWKAHEYMQRILRDDLKDPTKNQKQDMKAPCNDVLRVLECKGVERDILQQYMGDFKQQIRFNHANLIGVIDPTGLIPSGHVFIPGMGNKTPSRVFVTRNPCTEGRDGVVVDVASFRDMPDDAVEFFNSLGFGALVFALGDELPVKINEGDLDGDPYFCMWDEEVLECINFDNDLDVDELDFLPDDDVVGTERQYNIEGISRDIMARKKLQENPDTYLVETTNGAKIQLQLTRDQFYEGTDCLSKVIGHRSKGKGKKLKVEFNCDWVSGENNWVSSEYIWKEHPDNAPPQALFEYAEANDLLGNGLLPEKICKWLKKGFGEAELEKISKHRIVRGKIEVCCQYSDGAEDWVPIKEAKKDCKLFLGAYARENNLFGQSVWDRMDGYWLKEVHDVMCKQMRSNEISRLVSTLYRNWAKTFDDDAFGAKHPETKLWGRSYKQSLEIEKHGGVLQLPLDLRLKLSPKQRKYVEWE